MEQKKERAQTISDGYEILDTLKRIKDMRERLYIWQTGERTKERRVHIGHLKVVNYDKQKLDFRPPGDGNFRFNKPTRVFLFAPSLCMGFSGVIKQYDPKSLIIEFPLKMNVLTHSDFSSFNPVEDENEEAHAHKRAAPRKSVGGDKLVTIVRVSGDDAGEAESFPLADMSSGGMGFITYDPGEFVKGDIIKATAIDGTDLPKELKGEVVAIRKKDDSFDEFKVGVKFSTD